MFAKKNAPVHSSAVPALENTLQIFTKIKREWEFKPYNVHRVFSRVGLAWDTWLGCL